MKFDDIWKRYRLLLTAAAVGTICIVLAILISGERKIPGDGEPIELIVPRGASLQSIAERLSEKGLVGKPRWFVFQAILHGEDKDFKAGRYLVKPGTPSGDLRRMLVEGRTFPFKITVPEGLKLEEVAALWEETGLAKAEEITALARDKSLIDKFRIPTPTLEGYLYPDTYELEHGVSARDIIQTQVEKFRSVFTADMIKRAGALKMDRHQVIILASIIEKEAKLSHERPIISAVFHNRLRKRYPLQSCATVLYALGYHKPMLTYKDLRIESPYNTYLFRGLPKGPICSPGLSSIMAALFPADVDYFFFVANGDGSHTFTRKKSQHDQFRYIVKQKS